VSAAPPGVDARTWHYRDYYGVPPGAAGSGGAAPDEPVATDAPVLVVHGNCQAESLRVLLDGARRSDGTAAWRTVRVPPVHELVASDVAPLRRVLATADAVVAQPVRSGYRDLPIGTSDVLAAAPGARAVLVPIVRDARLRPWQALVRVPGAGKPPVAPYHDLRTLALAADGLGLRTAPRTPSRGGAGDRPTAAAFREVARRSQDELKRRQDRHGTLAADDLLEQAGADASHTVNHPGNEVLLGLARRVVDALGTTAAVTDPGRVLLRSVTAPLEAPVLEALGLPVARARPGWTVDGVEVHDAAVREAQLRWYRDHPEVVAAGLERHGPTMAVLGL
jgi:hypothetical protein